MNPLLSHEIPPAAAWSVTIRAGRELRLTALGPRANCSTLIFAAHDPVDRLNIPDTLKAQLSARIHPPMVLMSDRGTALVSVTGSSSDWHDCLTGHSLPAHVEAFGPTSYQADRNDWRRSARFGLLAELVKHGRGPADLHGCVNFFSRVGIAEDGVGSLRFVPGADAGGDWVRLRTEQDVLVVCSTAPHPLDPVWAPAAVRADIGPAASYGPDDPSMTWRPESARALLATKEILV